MKLNTVSRQIMELNEKLETIKQKQCQPINEQINKYVCKVRDIKKLINISKEKDAIKDSGNAATATTNNITDIKQKEDLIKYLEEKVNDNKLKLKAYSSFLFFLICSNKNLNPYFLFFKSELKLNLLCVKRISKKI